jgi:formylglycine-generating enzyme
MLVLALGGCRGCATPTEPELAKPTSNQPIAHRRALTEGAPDEATAREGEESATSNVTMRENEVPDAAVAAIPGGAYVPDSGPGDRQEIAPFHLDVHEVTVAEYRACVNAGACVAQTSVWWYGEEQVEEHCNFAAEPGPRDTHPMNCVDWDNAAAYCRWVGKRLPSEWEWEWAARGRDENRLYAWGASEPDEAICWRREHSGAGTCEVGSMAADVSRDGVRDLGGNVREWTDSFGHSPATDRPERVNRGGSWKTMMKSYLRVQDYQAYAADIRLEDLGFRCANA